MGLGTGWSNANSDMAGELRQRIIDQINERQAMQNMALQARGADRADRQQSIAEQEHAANMQDRREAMAQRGAGERDTAAGKAFPALGIGTAVEPQDFARTYAGTATAPNFTPERTLPATQTAGGMPLPGGGAGDGEGVEPNQAGVQTTTDAPRRITGRMVSMGTDQQRGDEEKKQLRGRLIANPNLTDRERLMISMEDAGLKVPANMEAKAGTIGEGSYMLNGKPIVAQKDPTGHVMYHGQDITNDPTLQPYAAPQHDPNPSYQLQPEIDPVTGAQTGKFKGYNTKSNRFEPVGGDTPASTKAAPGAAQDAAWNAKRSDAVAKLGIVDQSIDAAKDLIGPGAGRVATFEQMLGNPDPRISDLKTKLLTVKDQVVGALTRSNRQPSPAMMKRFDELLGTQLTPESLHAATNALRQMLQPTEGASNGGSGGSKRIVYDINGNPVK